MADSNDRGGKRPGRPGGRPPRGPNFSDRPQRGGGGPGGRGKAPGRFGGERSGGRDERPRPPRVERRDDRPRRPDHDRPERRPARQADADGTTPAPRVEAAPPAEERIAKVIARAGIASRRDAEAMIAEGRVTLNGETLTSPAVNVGAEDRITIDGEPLPSRERTRLWLFHKPRGLVTTARDPEGRSTVFDSLPEEMPRVVAIGRLDINTEGLLLLTNDGGLAKVIAHPETGWTRRYRARAHGEVTQADLDKLKKGVTVDEMEYGPIDATLDRVQGDNVWITLALKEGKNREVKRVLEHLGLQVNRLLRLSFGPFQLGDLDSGLVEEVRTRVLKDQLGQTLAEQAGVDFESPVREPIAPFGKPEKPGAPPKRGTSERMPRPRTARFESEREERPRGRRLDDRERGPARDERRARPEPRMKPHTVWRADEEEGDEAPRRPHPRRPDPKADRDASATRERKRVGAIASPEGRRVLVERLVSDGGSAERPRRPKGARPPRPARDDAGERPARPRRTGEEAFGRDREERRGPSKGRFGGARPPREERDGRGPPRGAPRPGGASRPGGSRPGGSRPGGGRPGGKPGGPPRGRGR
jgi:23S rRNA pseudouridine2605 synthase